MQLLPQGGSGTVQASSDAVRRVCSCHLMVSIDDETFVQEREAANCTDKRLEDTNIDLIYSDLLTPEEYKLLKMVAVHGYTVREAAAEFGINIEVCKKRVQRAKKKMKKILEEK